MTCGTNKYKNIKTKGKKSLRVLPPDMCVCVYTHIHENVEKYVRVQLYYMCGGRVYNKI